VESQRNRTRPAAKQEQQKVAPKKRFTIIKLEERIAPKKGSSGASSGFSDSSGGSVY